MLVIEFKCEDCGDDIVQFGVAANDVSVCATCQWIRCLPNEHDRERARAFLDRHHPTINGGPR